MRVKGLPFLSVNESLHAHSPPPETKQMIDASVLYLHTIDSPAWKTSHLGCQFCDLLAFWRAGTILLQYKLFEDHLQRSEAVQHKAARVIRSERVDVAGEKTLQKHASHLETSYGNTWLQ